MKVNKYGNILVWLVTFLLFFFVCIDSNLYNTSDHLFLFNRAEQMLNCIKDLKIPFFYYNDVNGVGYGSSFFYGQLTLLPFLPFVLVGKELFLKMYILAYLVLNTTGCIFLSKKFTKNCYLVTILYLTSGIFVTLHSLPANIMAIGISFFFIGYCIDFFRDKKNGVLASLLFFVLMNTHIITSVISFFICVIIMIYYFDRKRLIEYFRFAFITSMICGYVVMNYFYHLQDINLSHNKEIMEYMKSSSSSLFNAPLLFGGYLFKILVYRTPRTTVFNFLVLLLIIKGLKHHTKKQYFLLVLGLIGLIIGIDTIWFGLNDIHSIFFQFPVRYEPYILVLFFIICCRDIKITWFVKSICIFCILDIFITGAYMLKTNNNEFVGENYYQVQLGNREYVSDEFNDGYYKNHIEKVVANDNINLVYSSDKGVLKIEIPEHEKDWTLVIPKLYYKGYRTNQGYECYKGESQFVNIDIKDFSGTLEVYYEHPVKLTYLWVVSYLLVLLIIRNRRDIDDIIFGCRVYKRQRQAI